MKKWMSVLVLAATVVAPVAFAEEMAQSAPMGDMGQQGMMKMYHCSMDGYTSDKPGTCPLCGMKLQEKEMTADEAKKAMEESKTE